MIDSKREARTFSENNGLPDPCSAYAKQKAQAKQRGILWEFDFASWWAIWQPYFHLRGRGKNGFCMARELDDGPYSPTNVYLTTNLGNLRDYHRKSTKAIEARRKAKEKKEMAFARRGTTNAASRQEIASHLAFKSKNTSKSTCNIKEHDLEFEVSVPKLRPEES